MNALRQKIVIVGLVLSLFLNAGLVVALSTWRDYIYNQTEFINNRFAQQEAVIEALIAYDNILTTGACYGYIANVRLDYIILLQQWQPTPTEFKSNEIGGCLQLLEKITAAWLEEQP